MATIFISLDDTDNIESIGTGKLARWLAKDLEESGLVSTTNVTRHQLLVHPDVPYTSHNSCACIEAVTTNGNLETIAARAKGYLLDHFHEGANPGLCIVRKDHDLPELFSFGSRAQQEVIDLQEGLALADRIDAYTWRTGETGQGSIGALAAIGLRSSGNDGRFLALQGIRSLGGVVSVSDLLQYTAILTVESQNGSLLADHELVDTQDWIRPVLRRGQPVLVVERNGGPYWCSVEKKKGHGKAKW
jgi:hypothetical protein